MNEMYRAFNESKNVHMLFGQARGTVDDPDELMVGVVGHRRSPFGSSRGGIGQRGIPHARRRTRHLRGSLSDVVQKNSDELRDFVESVTQKEERSEERGEQRPQKGDEERSREHGGQSGDHGERPQDRAAASDGDEKRHPTGV